MSGKRSRLISIAAAGTATAAVISAVAFTLPFGSAFSASAADANLLDVNQQRTAQGETLSAQAQAQQYRVFSALGAQQAQHRLQVAQAAAAKATAAKKAAAAKAAAAKAAALRAAQQRAEQQRAVQQRAAQKQAQTTAASAPSGTPQQIAQQMLSQFGWSSSQFTCLQPLWEHESGWSVSASNPGSGAYGIPQALPGSQMASAGPDWQTNAATQIRWGLQYIQSRYGSPCGAWSHEQADGWY